MVVEKLFAVVLTATMAITPVTNTCDVFETNLRNVQEQLIELANEHQTTVTLVAAGDNLIHSGIIKSGKVEGGYDFNPMYEEVADFIQSFDVAVLNQETILVNDPARYSGYPCFGSPYEIGSAVINAGFDIVTHATNHAYDKGESGILESIAFWDSHNIPYAGINDSPDDNRVLIYEKKGIKIAILNYTYGLNGFVLPSGKEYLVNTLYDEEQLVADLQCAEENADISIVFPHWGNEYVYMPSEYQKRLAKLMVDNGADAIIGTHPHVIESGEEIFTDDLQRVPCWYSIGNFVSNQDEAPRMLGALACLTIVKDGNGTRVETWNTVPTITHISTYSEEFKVYLLENYTDELAAQHRLRRVRGSYFTTDYFWRLWAEVLIDDKIEF